MKKLAALSMLLTIAFGLSATTVSIGSVAGAANYFPIHTGYSYNYTQQIYTQSQINHAGEISRIRFYHHSSYPGSFGSSHDWVIYLGHTSRSSFLSTSDWEPATNLTQVFSGSVLDIFPAQGEWMEITLDTPFNYDNFSNLIVAIHESTPGLNYSVYWGSFATGSNTGLSLPHNSINPDLSNLPNARLLTDNLASIQLVFPDTEVPLPPRLISPADNAYVLDGQTLRWTLSEGSADASSYDVYIDGVLVSENQTSNRYTISGLETGYHTWQVVARNSIGSSLPSETRAFVVALAVGEGNDTCWLPISPNNYNSQSQSIYLQSEIASDIQEARIIEKIAYYWNGASACVSSNDWIVYMSHTNRTVFNHNADWLPISQMVQVFDGHLELPAVPGWIEIDLDTPFIYNNSSNLVIAVYEMFREGDYNAPTPFFANTATAGQHRSLLATQYNYHPGPNPPNDGFRVAAYPNILIWFAQLPDTPVLTVSPTFLDFGAVINGGSAEPLPVQITNMGAATLNLFESDISIIGAGASAFSFDPANLPASLGAAQSVIIPVSVTGVSTGEISATLRIVYEGQNHDVELLAEVLATGTIIIGTGTGSQPYPFDTSTVWQGSAALYTADQINASGSIHMLGWDCSSTSTAVIPYKIWATNTAVTTLESMSWQDMVADLTLLKEGTFTPNTLGWQSFQLETPFAYAGGNLIIAVETRYGSSWCGHAQTFKYTIGESRHLYWESSTYGLVNQNIPNIMMHFSSGLQDDICAFSITGSATPALGAASNYTVSIRNNGSNPQSNYQIKLMGPNNTVLASVNGQTINAFQTLEVVIPWTPTHTGNFAISGKVELPGDELIQNNQTGSLQVEVQPAGTQAVTIGAGDELAGYPIAFYELNSIYQTLYMADELGFECGIINSLELYNHFPYDRLKIATKIYMGSTDRTDLSTGWIPVSELTLVFDGQVNYPAGDNNILIHFQTPYVYAGGNLVVMFHRPDSGSFGWEFRFKCQTIGDNRARYALSYDEICPSDPPEGTLTGQFPQTTFLYHPGSPINDLGALSITGDVSPTVGTAALYTVRLRNYSAETQSGYAVKIMGLHDVQLASMTGPPINSGQSLDVEILWTPTTAGPLTIYGKVELDGDEFAGNNQTDPMQVHISPEDIQSDTIGAGDQLARFPLDFGSYGKYIIYQTLYREVELGFASGTITALALHNDFETHLPAKPTQIYLGSTDRTDMSEGYIPTSELSLVFEGLVTYPAGENTILIHFQTPYVHPGGNLVMMFCRTADGSFYSLDDRFKCQSGGRNRAFYTRYLNPNSPLSGEYTVFYPQVTFHYNADLIQNDLAAWKLEGNRTPTLGEASLYTLRIRNMGVQAQTNYTVKIMGTDDVELASVNGPPIAGLQSLDVMIPWTPTLAGDHTIYAVVEMTGDAHPANNRTTNFDLMVQPAGLHAVTAGDGSQDGIYPMGMPYRYFLYETLYYPDELQGFAGHITGVRFYIDFFYDVANAPVSIWLGTTTQADLSEGWLPSTQLTPVFDGLVDFPIGQNIIELTLDQPFMYVDGGNLVMLIHKPMGSAYASENTFRCQTQGCNRSRYGFDSYFEMDPAAPPHGFLANQFPQTTFTVIPGELGQVSGIVTDAEGQPLSGAELSINDGLFSTTTNDAGEYQFPHVLILPETYTLCITAYGYFDHIQHFELQADEQLTLNATLQLLPRVSLSGTVLASDTMTGIPGAVIRLDGYSSHILLADDQGSFTIPNLYGTKTYAYDIRAADYITQTGQIDLGDTDYDLGNIILAELTYAPLNVTAAVNDTCNVAEISWSYPDPDVQKEAGDVSSRIGNVRKASIQRQSSDVSSRQPEQSLSRSMAGLLLSQGISLKSTASKALIGYLVYRLQVNQEHYPSVWTLLTPEPITTPNFIDHGWAALTTGYYRWAVRSAYTNGVTSEPALSNHLHKIAANGIVVGTVRSKTNRAILGATITNGTLSTTTNSMGAYALTLPVGTHTLTASAPGYVSQTMEDVRVDLDTFTALRFVLLAERHDDPPIPVVATALHGNYPNPFNPETTISYSIKEEGRVKLEIYNIKGQLLRTLLDEDHATGHYKRIFNAKDDQGRSISSGVYLIRMTAPGYQKTSKMMLMR